MFLFLFVCLVSFLPILKISFILFCFYVVFCDKTKWSSCLHLVVLLPFLFLLFCFEFCLLFVVYIPLKKGPPQKTGHSQNPKKQKCRKTRQKKKSVSAVVFTDSVLKFFGVGLKISFFG